MPGDWQSVPQGDLSDEAFARFQNLCQAADDFAEFARNNPGCGIGSEGEDDEFTLGEIAFLFALLLLVVVMSSAVGWFLRGLVAH